MTSYCRTVPRLRDRFVGMQMACWQKGLIRSGGQNSPLPWSFCAPRCLRAIEGRMKLSAAVSRAPRSVEGWDELAFRR